MLFCVSRTGEPDPVGDGQGRDEAFAAFELAQPSRFCSDTYRGLDRVASYWCLRSRGSSVAGTGLGCTMRWNAP